MTHGQRSVYRADGLAAADKSVRRPGRRLMLIAASSRDAAAAFLLRRRPKGSARIVEPYRWPQNQLDLAVH
jgi:hypothetical protein